MKITRGIAWIVLVLGALAGLPLLILDQFPSVQLWHQLLVYYATFIPYVWVPVLLACAAAIVVVQGLWKFIPAGLFLVAALFWGIQLIGDTKRSPAPTGGLQYVSLNAQYGRADVDQLLAQVSESTTVVTVQEITASMEAALREAGFENDFPHKVGHAREDAGGTMIYSREPIKVLDEHETVFLNLVVSVEIDGVEYRFAAIHLAPPTMGPYVWERDARQVAQMLDRHLEEPLPSVAVGDYNAVFGHQTLDRFFNIGLTAPGHGIDLSNSALVTFEPTWPVGWKLPAFAQIDHALMSQFTAYADPHYFEISGTDHKGIAGGIYPVR